jgi:hypothetical protein
MDVPALAVEDDEGDGAFAGEERELCPDGACIGVIGPAGKCKVCGRVRGS